MYAILCWLIKEHRIQNGDSHMDDGVTIAAIAIKKHKINEKFD